MSIRSKNLIIFTLLFLLTGSCAAAPESDPSAVRKPVLVMPDLRGLDVEEARSKLPPATPVSLFQVTDPERSGEIVRTNPSSEQPLYSGQKVTLVVAGMPVDGAFTEHGLSDENSSEKPENSHPLLLYLVLQFALAAFFGYLWKTRSKDGS